MRSDTRRLFSRFSYMGLFAVLFVVLGNALISPTTRVYAEMAPTTTTVEEETTTTTTSTTTTTTTTIPPVAPGVPTGLSVAIMSRTSAVVSFAAPADEGSSPVSNYVIRTCSNPSTDRNIAPTYSGFYSEEVSFSQGSTVSFKVIAESEAGSSETECSLSSWDNRNPQVPSVVLVDPQAESVHFPQMLMYGPTYMTICVVPDIDLRFNGVDTSPINPFAIEPGIASDVIDELNANDGLLLTAAAFYSSQKLSRPSNVVISAYAVSDPTDNSTPYCNELSGAPFFEASVEIRPLNIGLKRRQVAVDFHRIEYEVGDPGPGGGTIFYVDMNRPVGSQYFEAACAGWTNSCDGTTDDPQAEWADPEDKQGCDGDLPGADGLLIGTGEQNTADILAGCATWGIAAQLADEYTRTVNGVVYGDWFLPSQDELHRMYAEQELVGGFPDNPYWSSSEVDDGRAGVELFFNGDRLFGGKFDWWYVRPVRSF